LTRRRSFQAGPGAIDGAADLVAQERGDQHEADRHESQDENVLDQTLTAAVPARAASRRRFGHSILQESEPERSRASV
jgi:hypothetical protein